MKESPQHELLSAYLDGAVSDEERAQVERWLADDPAARRTLDELRAVGSSLADMPKLELGEDLTDRVLRAAERHILSEPTRLADPPTPAPRAATVSIRSIARRLVTSRGLVWSGMAVAIAVLLTVFQFGSPEVRHPIAKSTEAPESPASPASPASTADGRPVIGPVGDEAEFASKAKGLSYASDSAAEAMAGADQDKLDDKLDMVPGVISKKPDDSRAPLAKKARAEAAVPAGSPPPRETAPWFADTSGTQSGQVAKSAPTGPIPPTSPAAAAPPTALPAELPATPVDTPVARAARNPADVLVVDCRFSPAALDEDAFSRTLAAHGIEIIETSDVEEPLARRLVENVVQTSPDLGQLRRGEPALDMARRRGGERSRKTASQQAEAATDASKLGAVPTDADAPADAEVEFVLVEGSPSQIAATIHALSHRGDATVAVSPKHQARFDKTLEQEGLRLHAAAQPTEPRGAGASGGPVAKGGTSDRERANTDWASKPSPRDLEESVAAQRQLGRRADAPQDAPPRATAQRLGRVALREAPPIAVQRVEAERGRPEGRISQKPPEPAERLVESAVEQKTEQQEELALGLDATPSRKMPAGNTPAAQTIVADRSQIESRSGAPQLQQVLFVLHRTPLAEPARAAASTEVDAQAAPVRAAETPDAAPAPSSAPAKNHDKGE